jgi:hypothetical protein
MREQLEGALAARQMIRLRRDDIDAATIYGFPLAIGPELVLLAVEHDWRLDGYAIVRLADVTKVRSNEFDRFTERVLEAKGELRRLDGVGRMSRSRPARATLDSRAFACAWCQTARGPKRRLSSRLREVPNGATFQTARRPKRR